MVEINAIEKNYIGRKLRHIMKKHERDKVKNSNRLSEMLLNVFLYVH